MEGFLGDTTVVNETPSDEFCPENEQEAENPENEDVHYTLVSA